MIVMNETAAFQLFGIHKVNIGERVRTIGSQTEYVVDKVWWNDTLAEWAYDLVNDDGQISFTLLSEFQCVKL